MEQNVKAHQLSKATTVAYELNGAAYASAMLASDVTSDTHMLMLMAPNFSGMNERALQRGERFAAPDRDVFVIDIYASLKTYRKPLPRCARLMKPNMKSAA